MKTCGEVPKSRLRIDQKGGNYYQPIHHLHLRDVFEVLPPASREFDLIDFGSGKGRVLIAACAYPFRNVVGIELDPRMHAIAEQNLERYRGPRRCRSVRSTLGDILEFEIPPTEGVYFFCAPMYGDPMRRILGRVCDSMRQHPRDAFVVYHNPTEAATIDDSGVFRRFWVGGGSIVWRSC